MGAIDKSIYCLGSTNAVFRRRKRKRRYTQALQGGIGPQLSSALPPPPPESYKEAPALKAAGILAMVSAITRQVAVLRLLGQLNQIDLTVSSLDIFPSLSRGSETSRLPHTSQTT